MKTRILPRLAAVLFMGLMALNPAAHAAHDDSRQVSIRPDVTFTLRTDISGGKLVFIGESGKIKDMVNPDLKVPEDSVVQINLVNGDGAVHDIAVPDLNAQSDQISGKGSATAIVFRTGKAGELNYVCTLPGHIQAGMIGKMIVGEGAVATEPTGMEVAKNPTEVGKPIGKRGPQKFTVKLETTEVVGQLDDGSTYKYWTFNDTVPGPFIRARVGDTITVDLANASDSKHIHSVDFHAVTGPGGGAAVTQAAPGQTKSFTFKAMSPGLFVYHCATPMVAQHISNGMYGLILIEPEGGLEPVDREFYVMQGELYTTQAHGVRGEHEFSLERLLDERPSHLSFNGTMGALTSTHKMQAKVGETVRIFFGVGGPNATSSFHVIGEIFDRVYRDGDLITAPSQGVQTVSVGPGSAAMVEFKTEVPGRYILVDHALSRMEKGLAGFLDVAGPENPEIFHSKDGVDPSSGH
jgi:nitrite reductase (NO-forming)